MFALKKGSLHQVGVNMAVVEGYVEKIVFRNSDNGYTVFHLSSKGEEITCVGTFQLIAEGNV